MYCAHGKTKGMSCSRRLVGFENGLEMSYQSRLVKEEEQRSKLIKTSASGSKNLADQVI